MSFKEVCDFQNLVEAGLECCRGGRWKGSVQMFELNILQWAAQKHSELINGEYKPGNTRNFLLKERGKIRQIKAHDIRDRMVYKSFCQHELWSAVDGLIMKRNFASQKGKGTDCAIDTFKKDLVHAYKSYGTRDFYVTIFDFHDYFGTIPHENSYDLIAPRLSDDSCRSLLKQYLDIFPGDAGVGIGGEPSQVIAIVYPSKIDRTLACDQRVLANGRYMDDSYFITRTKEDARAVSDEFRRITKELKLTINEKHSKTYWMKRDQVTFLKKRTFITETGKVVMRLTKKNVTDELRRLKKQKIKLENGEMPREAIEASFQCWCSYACKYNSYHSLVTVTDLYCKLFDVQWSDARKFWK